jgi:fumarylacetoacetate (FAA) hydrolase
MKLATLKDGTRDGRLVVVSRDLSRAAPAPHVKTLQAALDDWESIAPELAALAARLEEGMIAGTLEFRAEDCLSPLPRAYQWADGSAYVNHVELVRKARGAEMPPSFWTDPLMYQGGSDTFLGPTQDIPLGDESWGCDLEAEVAVITGDVPYGATPAQAAAAIRLVLLVNDVSLRGLIPSELAKGFGFLQSKPRSALSLVLVTPDELGEAWKDDKLHLPMRTWLNGKWFGEADCGVDMQFSFAQLVAHVAKTRPLTAGTIIGSGTIANQDTGKGASCLAEQRTVETLRDGKPSTPFMKFGDRLRIEVTDARGASIFGAIEQTITPLKA